ncbi:hypothetical protein DB346_08135 [Verrucomicrobia bacterium LW23]|nr:hypothetical protein DB346_08135 [Verrucomicrobia bacterium LW23]
MKQKIARFVAGDTVRTPMHADAINELVDALNKLLHMNVINGKGKFEYADNIALNLDPGAETTEEEASDSSSASSEEPEDEEGPPTGYEHISITYCPGAGSDPVTRTVLARIED